MTVGKSVRLNRIFSHPTGRLCSIAVDHFIGYQNRLPDGLTDLPKTIAEIVEACPDAITMNRGVAMTCWGPHAGKIPLIIQSGCFTADDGVMEMMAGVEDILRLGADALAVSIGVRGPNEGKYLKMLSNQVTDAARFEVPVIAHIYPRDFREGAQIVHDAENIAWAVRCGIECGADIIKVAYTGDIKSFADIIAGCPVPIVAAGGPKCESLDEALRLMRDVVASGARGATIGRNVWGSGMTGEAIRKFKSVIHDGV